VTGGLGFGVELKRGEAKESSNVEFPHQGLISASVVGVRNVPKPCVVQPYRHFNRAMARIIARI
jgi:hypothetical protein